MSPLVAVELGTLGILVICSVLVLAVVLERIIAYRKEKKRQKSFQGELKALLDSGDEEGIKNISADSQAPLATVLNAIYETGTKLRPDQTQQLLAQAMDGLGDRLRRFLAILATLAGTAPFIGLFGTVMGIMHTFSAIAEKGFGGPAVVSAGISQALIATAFGLGVAIPAVMFYNMFNRKVVKTMKTTHAEATQILIMLGRL